MREVDDGDVSVLFIEDDAAIAEVYKLRLELDGCNVRVAGSGEAGLEEVNRQLPDIIFLDLDLPGMSGLAVLAQLRTDRITEKIPVIILSNYSEKEMIERGLKLGAHDYLIKVATPPATVSGEIETRVKKSVPSSRRSFSL